MTHEQMSRSELSLLLFLECASVDYGGAVAVERMNDDDIASVEAWHESGFVSWSRIASDCLPLPSRRTYCCTLSEEAWSIAQAERRARYERMAASRSWFTTDEKRNAHNWVP